MVLFIHLKIILLQCFQFSVFNFCKISSIQTDPKFIALVSIWITSALPKLAHEYQNPSLCPHSSLIFHSYLIAQVQGYVCLEVKQDEWKTLERKLKEKFSRNVFGCAERKENKYQDSNFFPGPTKFFSLQDGEKTIERSSLIRAAQNALYILLC